MEEHRALADLAVDFWKLLKAFERTIERLPHDHAGRSAAQLRYSAGRLDLVLRERGVKLVTFDGKEFEPGIPATAVNSEDFTQGGRLIVESTVEPAVMQNMTVLRLGKVVLTQPTEVGAGDVSRD